jgi:hypothetical protein
MKGSLDEHSSRGQKDRTPVASIRPRGLRLGASGAPRRQINRRIRAQCHSLPHVHTLSHLHTPAHSDEGPHCHSDAASLSNANGETHGDHGTLADTRAG